MLVDQARGVIVGAAGPEPEPMVIFTISVEELRDLLDSEHHQDKQYAATLLAYLAADADNHSGIHEIVGISRLINLLAIDDLPLQISILIVLANFSCNSDYHANIILGAVRFIGLLNVNHPELQGWVAELLANLAHENPGYQTVLAGSIQALVNLLAIEDLNLRKSTLKALQALLENNSANCKAAAIAGGIFKLRCLQCVPEPDIAESAGLILEFKDLAVFAPPFFTASQMEQHRPGASQSVPGDLSSRNNQP